MNIMEALKIECKKSFDGYGANGCRPAKIPNNDQSYLRYGAFTVDVTSAVNADNLLPLTNSACHNRLKQLELMGRVVSRANPGGSTRWWPSGYRPNQ